MLNLIDSIFSKGYSIKDIQIYRMRNIKGMKEPVDNNGLYPYVSTKTMNCQGSASAFWLASKHAQLRRTDLSDILSVKKLFAGVYATKQSELIYQEKTDSYIQKFLTYTVGNNNVRTKEFIIIEFSPNENFGVEDVSLEELIQDSIERASEPQPTESPVEKPKNNSFISGIEL